ncbi:MAG TPA: hypothetical protein VN026_01455, partial [Bacteroidia bacterium]|nr:hypothetical protein [Bacteroidia bacterium]
EAKCYNNASIDFDDDYDIKSHLKNHTCLFSQFMISPNANKENHQEYLNLSFKKPTSSIFILNSVFRL